MNIGIFTNNYFPNPYGVTGSIESFRKQFEKKGHRVFIFAPQWKGYEDKNPDVFRYPSIDINFKFKFPLAIPYSGKIDEIIRNLDLDIIHSQHPNLLGTAAKKWARKKGIPLVFTWHTLYDKYAHFVVVIPEKVAAKWMISRAVKYANKCDQIITPTESVKKIIRGWGVTRENIEVIPTGVEEEFFQNADGKSVRERYRISDDETLLLLVSRLTSEKNIEFLFKSVSDILKKKRNVKFLVVGGGCLISKLKQYAEKEKISGQVIFAGEVNREKMNSYFNAGDIFVYASKSETQGMIITESMCAGLPVVAVDATGICDLVVDKESGFLVTEKKEDFSSAVAKLIDDRQLRKQFSENSKRIAKENYTSEVTADKMLKVYEKLINQQ